MPNKATLAWVLGRRSWPQSKTMQCVRNHISFHCSSHCFCRVSGSFPIFMDGMCTNRWWGSRAVMGYSQLRWRFAWMCTGQSRDRSPVLETCRRARRIVVSHRQLSRICVRPRTRSERIRSTTRQSSALDRSRLCWFGTSRRQQLRSPCTNCAHCHRWQHCDLELTINCGGNSAKPSPAKQLWDATVHVPCHARENLNMALTALTVDTPFLTQTVAPTSHNSRILNGSKNNRNNDSSNLFWRSVWPHSWCKRNQPRLPQSFIRVCRHYRHIT